MLETHRDTVEEAWTWSDVADCMEIASSESVAKFRDMFSDYLGVTDCQLQLMPSGRFGLERLLRSLKAKGSRKVLAPAFNCGVVKEAIERAGWTVVPYDFTEKPGEVDRDRLSQLLRGDVSALIIGHFFGVPVDFRWLEEFCRTKEIAVIEDCAHTLGGTIGDRMAGTIGDASIFSFNYDKPISLGWGGAVLIRNTSLFANDLDIRLRTLSLEDELDQMRRFLGVMAARRRDIPRSGGLLFRARRKLRLSRLRAFSPPNVGIGGLRAELGIWQLKAYRKTLGLRNRNAEIVSRRSGRCVSWWVDATVRPAWLKQKVLFPSRADSLMVSRNLQLLGIRAGNFNWNTLITSETQEYPNAFRVARAALDIPIHQNMDREALDMVSEALSDFQ